MPEGRVPARRMDSQRPGAEAEAARVAAEADPGGRGDAPDPAEMLTARLAAGLLKGATRAAPLPRFEMRGIEVGLHGPRRASPPRMPRIDGGIVVDPHEADPRLDLLHRNLRECGAISDRLAEAAELVGTIRRKD